MPAPQEQSVESARVQIEDMLWAMGENESPGFSKFALDQESMKLLECERDEKTRKARIVIEMVVTEGMANQLGSMHGGCAATILDNLTSMVLFLHTSGQLGDPWSMLGVSQSIQIIYTAPAPVGEYIDIECSTLAIGKSVGVMQCEIWTKDGKGGKRLRRTATGTHTKIDNSASKSRL
ncbi:hypothetical protein CBS101457_004043 [Exobasidium rhododendri]|nr:hypothetical protein CBS101457_004043 [Exobasidium rhododendri]